MLNQNRNQIKKLISSRVKPTWNNFIGPLEEHSDHLERLWAPVSHLNAVRDNEDLRRAYENCLSKLSDYGTELGQNKRLFAKFKKIRDGKGYSKLNKAQQKSIENELLDFELSGVALDKKSRARFKKITSELSELGNQYSQNVLDATDAWSLQIDKEKDLAGLPESVIEAGKNKAIQQEKSGWVFTLHAPSYVPFLTYANDQALREEMYVANVTRASDVGPNSNRWDNSESICQILNLRKEKANLLGFKNYASYSVETKMANSPEEVAGFLKGLAEKSLQRGKTELEELNTFAREKYGKNKLNAWDYAWVSEKLKIDKYDISQEVLRPYFPLPKVLSGMFRIVNKIFGISIKEEVLEHSWHRDVKYFKVIDNDGEIRGYFFVDLYARERKRGGAWMGEYICRRRIGNDAQVSVAFLTCNFPEPINQRPSLLSHEEVMTLFHEFGHSLHHILTRIEVSAVAGINGVPWDAVELPSQFLENWCWEREALDLISEHYETGEKIPDKLLKKMHAAKNFQSAMQMLRQIEFSMFDLAIHRLTKNIKSPKEVRKILTEVRKQVAIIKPPEYNRFENSFGHIFAGGYAAGYYSYKWAEVLSADAYSMFEDNGIFDSATGRSFLENILEKGGSEDPIQLFQDFRGRNPRVDALLRHSGLS